MCNLQLQQFLRPSFLFIHFVSNHHFMYSLHKREWAPSKSSEVVHCQRDQQILTYPWHCSYSKIEIYICTFLLYFFFIYAYYSHDSQVSLIDLIDLQMRAAYPAASVKVAYVPPICKRNEKCPRDRPAVSSVASIQLNRSLPSPCCTFTRCPRTVDRITSDVSSLYHLYVNNIQSNMQ